MTVLVGIDEAGFGPILGPLVVSSSALRLPEKLLDADLWEVLRKSVSKTRRHPAGRLLVADSKKVYSRSRGIGQLRRSVLTFMNCLGSRPRTLNQLLSFLSCDCLERLPDYPWYENTDKYRIETNDMDISIAGNVLKKDLASNNIKLVELKSRCIDVGRYNQMVNTTGNKSSVLFSTAAALIQKAWDSFAGEGLQIIIDRHGGRVRYGRILQRAFGALDLTILRESKVVSSYLLCDKDRYMKLHFVTKGDEKYLTTALASMVSKFVRELLIDNINCYFRSFHKDLKATAGYYQDGRRFIRDLQSKTPRIEYDKNKLIRCR